MICPKCESEYVAGVTTCADCGETLISSSEFEGSLVHPEDWVIAYTCSESFEADGIKNSLESADIETLILSQKDSSFPISGDLSVIKILVKKTDAEDAVSIIKDIENQSNNSE